MGKDYYRILGLHQNAAYDEVRKAYKGQALRYHPDRNNGDTGAAECFKEVAEAYEVLSDKRKREMYDMYGEESLKSGPPALSRTKSADTRHYTGYAGFATRTEGGSHRFEYLEHEFSHPNIFDGSAESLRKDPGYKPSDPFELFASIFDGPVGWGECSKGVPHPKFARSSSTDYVASNQSFLNDPTGLGTHIAVANFGLAGDFLPGHGYQDRNDAFGYNGATNVDVMAGQFPAFTSFDPVVRGNRRAGGHHRRFDH